LGCFAQEKYFNRWSEKKKKEEEKQMIEYQKQKIGLF